MNDNEEIASHALEFVKAAFVVLSSDETILNECLQLIFTGKNIFLQIRLKKEANNFLKPTIWATRSMSRLYSIKVVDLLDLDKYSIS